MSNFGALLPMAIERDEIGCWTHPVYQDYYSKVLGGVERWTEEEWQAFELNFNIKAVYKSFYDDVSVEVADKFDKAEDPDLTFWEPTNPEGEGWFIIQIHHSEDGPYVVWAKPVDTEEQVK